MEINEELIEKVSKNARLKLTKEEKEEFLSQLKEILDAFSTLKEADTDNLHPSFQPLLLKDITREDKIESCLTQEQALQNTPHKKEGFFKGPKVM